MPMDAPLKQRLIGAIVLIALAVIFLPLLVKGPAPDSGVANVSMAIPPEPRAPDGMVTQDLPLVAPGGAPASGATGMPMPSASTTVDGGQSAMPAGSPADADPTSLAAVAAGDFVVSFGNYATRADADKVIAVLRDAGLPGFAEPVSAAAPTPVRVRVGPFADRATAESARIRAARIRSDVEIRVIATDAAPSAKSAAQAAAAPMPALAPTPEKSAPLSPSPAQAESKPAAKPEPAPAAKPDAKPAPAAIDPAKGPPPPEPAAKPPANAGGTGFVVQIGAFASASDATAQRDALRTSGFNAFTDTVPGANGTLTRVRVGPVMTRAEADALKARLQAAGRDGMVRPHP